MKLKFLKLSGFVLIFLIPGLLWAVPRPETGKETQPTLGVYKSDFGFEIQAANTNWIQTKPPQKSRFIETIYRSPIMRNNVHASLTVRVDNMKNKTNLKSYVKRWVREYPKYGYDVLGSQPFKKGSQWGYVIDLIHPGKNRQIRQVIHLSQNVAVIITCRDHSATFSNSLKECNRIIKNFASSPEFVNEWRFR